jgi:hypothetical protein
MKKWMIALWRWWQCTVMQSHDWTTDFQERGNKAPDLTGKVTAAEIYKAWVDDVRMYCKHCGHESEVSKAFQKRVKQPWP